MSRPVLDVDGVLLSGATCTRTGDRRPAWLGLRRSAARAPGIEIQDRLRQHPEVKNYAIIDVDHDMLPEQQPHFVQVQSTTGLMRGHMSLAAAILDGSMISPASQETVRGEELPLAA